MASDATRHGTGDERLVSAVRRSSLLRGLADEDLSALLSSARLVRRASGRVLLRGTEDTVLVLLDGAAKEHRTSTGHDVVIAVLAPGDAAGLTSALGTPTGGDVTALIETTGLLIPGRALRSLARDRNGIALAWLRATTEQLDILRDELLMLSEMGAADRVVRRLVQLADRLGQRVEGETRILLHLTQEELASWAAASRESAAKALHTLRRAGIVVTGRRSLSILDLDALHHRAGIEEPDPPRPAIGL